MLLLFFSGRNTDSWVGNSWVILLCLDGLLAPFDSFELIETWDMVSCSLYSLNIFEGFPWVKTLFDSVIRSNREGIDVFESLLIRDFFYFVNRELEF